MNLIFLSFANSQQRPLPTLKEEDDKVYSTLARRAMQQHFAIHRDSNTTIPNIAEYLVLFRDAVTVFLFSGHAGRDKLLLDEQVAQAAGIAGLLGQCPKLKLIVLNGCSTIGQVQRLLALENHPVVIATSAPVEDRSATQFSISFFQALTEQYATIGEAFQAALAAAQTAAGSTLEAGRSRQPEGKEEEPVWGLFYSSEQALEWKLPQTPYADPQAGYQPNQRLIGQLIEQLSPFNAEVAKIHDDESQGLERSILDKREAILKCLPHPISEQLRKLLVPEQGESGVVFYDKPGPARLRQMAVTYQTLIELIAYLLLAQLWDALAENKERPVPPVLLDQIKGLFRQPAGGKEGYDFLGLIRELLPFLEKEKTSFFVPELRQAGSIFWQGSGFCHGCRFMETVWQRLFRKPEPDTAEAVQLCAIGEEKLAGILGQLGFIAHYTLASVKDIDVIKFRHLTIPRFKHRMVKLVQRFVGLAEEQKILEQFMDNASVLLLPNENGKEGYLNLSPFLIDESAFEERAGGTAKLHFFDHYEQAEDCYAFKHVYKPDDPLLRIHQQPNFRVVKVQFDAFAQLLFHQPMKEAV